MAVCHLAAFVDCSHASTIVLWAKPSSRFRSPLAESIIWGFWAFIGLGCMGVASMIWSAVKKCLENNYADRMPESACK